MDVISIFRLLNKNYGILLSSVLFAALTYFYTASLPEYRSESIMYTGIESGVGNMIDGGLGFVDHGRQSICQLGDGN